MNEDEIKEELESLLSFPKIGKFVSWDDGDCIRFTENLAMVLEGMDQCQLGEMRELIWRLAGGQA